MTKDLWPEEERWPGEQLGEAFRSGETTGRGETRVIHQAEEESQAAFRMRLATEKATAPEAVWICVLDESEGRGR